MRTPRVADDNLRNRQAMLDRKGSTHTTKQSRLVGNMVITSNYDSKGPEIKETNNCHSYIIFLWAYQTPKR